MSKRDWHPAPAPTAPLLPCPHCGQAIVEKTDHHGSWYGHSNDMASCMHGVTQLHDQHDYDQWNRRA